MDTLISTQPESYRHLIKRSFGLYKSSFKRVIIQSFLLALITFIPRILSDYIGQDIFAGLAATSPHRLWLFVIELASFAFLISIIWRMHCVLHQIREPLIEDIKVAVRKIIAVFIASLIEGVMIASTVMFIYWMLMLQNEYQTWLLGSSYGMITLFLCTIIEFGIILYVASLFVFLLPLIAVEDKGILNAIKTSIYLGWNHSYRIITTQITPWLSYLVTLMVFKYLFKVDFHIYLIQHTSQSGLITFLHICLFTLYIPWFASLLIVQLKDLELRKHISSNL